uniref:Complex I assembly factor TIMMDC1, mitochondrial n=1 Tax=Ditylenchus dipsaci TaxID=166011 RepID=A0A915EN64_9BILA
MSAKKPVVSSSDDQSGWDRIRDIYRLGSVSMEKDFCKTVASASFMAGAFTGGIIRHREAMSRFDTYAAGRIKGGSKNLARRKVDFGMTMFVRNGFRGGLHMALLFTPVIVATTHITAYRNHFSPYIAPAAVITCGCVYALPLGLPGIVKAFKISLLPGFLATVAPYCYELYHGLESADSAYWHFKKYYEDEITKERQLAERVQEFKKKEGIWFNSVAERRLLEADRVAKENKEDEKYSD